jgi:hypothetical protein
MQCHVYTDPAQFIEAIPNGLLFCSAACQLIEVQTRRSRSEKTPKEFGKKKRVKPTQKLLPDGVEYSNAISFLQWKQQNAKLISLLSHVLLHLHVKTKQSRLAVGATI